MSHGEGEVKISIFFSIKNSVSFSTDITRNNFAHVIFLCQPNQ